MPYAADTSANWQLPNAADVSGNWLLQQTHMANALAAADTSGNYLSSRYCISQQTYPAINCLTQQTQTYLVIALCSRHIWLLPCTADISVYCLLQQTISGNCLEEQTYLSIAFCSRQYLHSRHIHTLDTKTVTLSFSPLDPIVNRSCKNGFVGSLIKIFHPNMMLIYYAWHKLTSF